MIYGIMFSAPAIVMGDLIWKFAKILWDKKFSYIYERINLYAGS